MNGMRRGCTAALVFALVGELAGAQATLWTVDDDGPADFATIQAAVDAAADGDGILIRAGVYDGFDIEAKGLALIADTAGTVLVERAESNAVPTIEVRDTGPGQTVTFLGLEVVRLETFFSTGEAIRAVNCVGTVWVESCFLRGLGMRSALGLEGASSAVVVRSTLQGSVGDDLPFLLGICDGLYARDSHVYLYESDLTGSDGSGGECGDELVCGFAPWSGNGVTVYDSTAFVSGCVLTGGTGGDGAEGCIFQTAGDGSDGGDGVTLAGSDPSSATVIDTGLFPGTAGSGSGLCDDGVDGEASEVAAGSTLVELRGVSRSLAATTPVREGEVSTLVFRGAEDDFVFGIASPFALGLLLPGFRGPFLLGVPFNLVPVGTLPASGEATLRLTSGLPDGWDFAVRYLQSLHVTPSAEAFLSAPTALVVLDSSF